MNANRWTKSSLIAHLKRPEKHPKPDGSRQYLSVATSFDEMHRWSMDELENTHADFHGLPFPERAHGPAEGLR